MNHQKEKIDKTPIYYSNKKNKVPRSKFNQEVKDLYSENYRTLKQEVEECGELFHTWEMWLGPCSEKPVGSEVGGLDPRPWIGSPVGNQACIIPRLL